MIARWFEAVPQAMSDCFLFVFNSNLIVWSSKKRVLEVVFFSRGKILLSNLFCLWNNWEEFSQVFILERILTGFHFGPKKKLHKSLTIYPKLCNDKETNLWCSIKKRQTEVRKQDGISYPNMKSKLRQTSKCRLVDKQIQNVHTIRFGNTQGTVDAAATNYQDLFFWYYQPLKLWR